MTKEKNIIIGLYIGLLLTLIFQCIPIDFIQIVSLFMLLAMLMANKNVRKEKPMDSFLYTHSFFISRTLWMTSVILTAGAGISGAFLAEHFGFERLLDIAQDLARGERSDEMRLIFWVVLIGIIPGIIYLIQRVGRGLKRAIKALPPAKPGTWL